MGSMIHSSPLVLSVMECTAHLGTFCFSIDVKFLQKMELDLAIILDILILALKTGLRGHQKQSLRL